MDENYVIGVSVEGADEAAKAAKNIGKAMSNVGKDAKGLDLFGEKVEKVVKKTKQAKKSVDDLEAASKQLKLDFGSGKGLDEVSVKSEKAAKALKKAGKAAKESSLEVKQANEEAAKSADAVVQANERVAASAEKSAKSQHKAAQASDEAVKGRGKAKQSADAETKSVENTTQALDKLDNTGRKSRRKKSSEENIAALKAEEAQAKKTAAANLEAAASRRVPNGSGNPSPIFNKGLNLTALSKAIEGLDGLSKSGKPFNEDSYKSLSKSVSANVKAAAAGLSALAGGSGGGGKNGGGNRTSIPSGGGNGGGGKDADHENQPRLRDVIKDIRVLGYDADWRRTNAVVEAVKEGKNVPPNAVNAAVRDLDKRIAMSRIFNGGDKTADSIEAKAMTQVGGAEFTHSVLGGYGLNSERENLKKYLDAHTATAEKDNAALKLAKFRKPHETLAEVSQGLDVPVRKLRQAAEQFRHLDALSTQFHGGLLSEGKLRQTVGSVVADKIKGNKGYYGNAANLLTYKADRIDAHARQAADEARLQREAAQAKKSREKSLNRYRVMQDIDKTLEAMASGREVPTREINSKLKTLKNLLTASENIAATPELSREHRDRHGDRLYNQLKQPKKIERRISAFEDELEYRRYQQWFEDKAASDAKAQAVKSRGYTKQSVSGSKEVQGVVDAVAKTQAAETKLSDKIGEANRKYSDRVRFLQESLSLQNASVSSVRREVSHLKDVESAYQRVRSLGSGKSYEYAKSEFIGKHGSGAFSDGASAKRNSLIAQADNYRLKKALNTSDALHQTWRGLTAAAGQIWLSWGNIAAMLTGLAAGFAVFQSLSVERKFGWEIEQVGIVGAQSEKQLRGLRQTILDINQSGSLQGPIEMAQALGVLAKAGLKTEDSLGNLKSVLNFSLTADISNEQGALFAAGLRSAFNLETPEQLRVGLDQTAKAADVSQTSIEAMSEALKQASPVASRFGLSVSDTSAALALLARYNIEGSSAGTSFRNFLTDLAGRTDKSKAALKELGISFYDARGQARPLLEVVRDVQAALGNLSPKDQQDWLKKIFDERGLKTASILLSEAGKDFEKILLQISRGGENLGYTERAATKLADTSEGAFRRMKNAWEGFFADVGSRAEDPFKGMLDGLSKIANDNNIRSFASSLTNGFLNVVTAASTLIRALSPLAPLISGLTSALGAFVSVKLAVAAFGWVKGLTAAAGAFTALKSTLALAGAQMATISALGNPIAGAFAAASTAARGFVAALGPIGLAAAAIGVGVTAYFYATRDSVFSLRDEINKLDKSLGSVNFEKYERFNEQGLGAKIDAQLALGGIKRSAENDNLATALLPEKAVQDFIENTNKITAVTNQALSEINNNSSMSAQERAEQELMVTERKHTLLKQQLERFDAATKDIETLDTASANVRKDLERQVYEAAVAYTDKRAKYALQQMLNLQVEAVKTRNILEAAFDVGGWNEKARKELNAIEAAKRAGIPLTAEQKAFERKKGLGQPDEQAYAASFVNNPSFDKTNKYLKDHQADTARAIAKGDAQARAAIERQKAQTLQEIAKEKQNLDLLKFKLDKTPVYSAAGVSSNPGESRSDIGSRIQKTEKRLKQLNRALDDTENVLNAAEAMTTSGTKRTDGKKFEDSIGSPLTNKNPDISKLGRKNRAGGGSGVRDSVTTAQYRAFDANAKLMELEVRHRKHLTNYLEDSLRRKQSHGVMGTKEEYLAKAQSMYGNRSDSHANYLSSLKSQYLDYYQKAQDPSKSPQDRAGFNQVLAKLGEQIRSISPKGTIEIGSLGTVTTTNHTVKNGGGIQPTVKTPRHGVNQTVLNHARQYDYAEIERRYGLPKNTLASVEMQESRGNVNAVSNVGAKGAFQFMPATAEQYGVDVRSVKSSAEGAARYLSDAMKNLGGDIVKALTAYHSGEGNVRKGKIGPVGRAYASQVLGYTAWLDNGGTPNTVNQVGSKYTVSSSTSTGRDGEVQTKVNTSSTNKSYSFNTHAVTLDNPTDGAYAQTNAGLTQEQIQAAANALEMADKIKNTKLHQNELDRLSLETEIAKGNLSKGQIEHRRGLLDLSKLQAEHEIRMQEIQAQYADNAPARLEAEQRETEQYQKRYELAVAKNNAAAGSEGFLGGTKTAFDNMAKNAGDSAQLAAESVNWLGNFAVSTFDRMVIEGKKSFRDFAKDAIKQLARIAARMAIMKIIGSIGGAMFGGASAAGAGAGGSVSGAASGSNYLGPASGGLEFIPKVDFFAAKGGAFDTGGRLRAYAMGGIVNSPTNFMHAGGRGLMGESGPEAIMPLTRLPNGDLGVTMAGGGQGGTFVNQPVSINVTVHSDGKSENDGKNSDSKMGRELAQSIETVVQQVLAREMRHGGTLAGVGAK